MLPSSRIPRARIDLSALRHNLGVIRRAAPGTRVMAVIKANAYGHGMVAAAMALGDADAFAVARLEEAIELRAAGVGHPLVLLEGAFNAAQLTQAAQLGLELVVHDGSQLDMLETTAIAHRFIIWVKLDTGMNRLGFRIAELAGVWQRLRALAAPPLEMRLMTHLARADEPDAALTAQQLQRFRAAHSTLAGTVVTSVANSPGIFGGAARQGEWVRPGIALYGVSPFADRSASALGLRPVMSFESAVIALHDVARGETVGYGGAWRAARDSRVAIIAAGYADGVPRQLPNGTPLLVGAQRAPLAGRVSMDMTAVDVTDLPQVRVGTNAVLWGPDLPAEDVAAAAGTIAYELLSRLGRRVQREYSDE